MTKPYDFSWTDDFRNNAEVDRAGNLVLRLTEKQKEDWQQHEATAITNTKNIGVEW